MIDPAANKRVGRFAVLAIVAGVLCAGCGDEDGVPAQPPTAQPEGWDSEIALREAVDENPDPDVVEVRLTARQAPVEILAGTTTDAWTYDGGIPGPLIRAKVGDRLIVHFDNELAEQTTVHWHGVRVPVEMDGVPDHSGPAIAPGGGFDYEFVVPDAGLFWYHPHFHSAAQVGNGLYGALLVEDPGEPAALGDELVVVLSDIALEDDGSLKDPDASGELAALFGREGDVILANGRVRPTVHAVAGLRQRWRLVNSAKSRYFQLELAGHELTRIGGDGGLITTPVRLDRLLLAPGERADVLVTPRGAPGEELVVRWIPFDRGYGTHEFRHEQDVFAIRLADGLAGQSPPEPAVTRDIAPLDLDGATPVDIRLTQADVDGHIVLGINDVPFEDAVPFEGSVHETQIWTITNEMEWAHPFHLHGFFFQVLDAQGEPLAPLEWKDTVHVPVDKSVRMAVEYDDRPGMWMFHCHILDHADLGMMGMLHLASH